MVLAVRAASLRIGYEEDHGVVWVVDKIDLSIKPGMIYCIAGESGCGKTTLGNVLSGVLPPHGVVDGILEVFGRNVVRGNYIDYNGLRGKIVSRIPQNPGLALSPYLSIGEQIADVLKVHHRIDDKRLLKEKSMELLKLVNLPSSILDYYPHELSGGMQQRAAIALAIASKPRLIVADEPTSSLDASLRSQILGLLVKLRRELGVTIVLITHDLYTARYVCDRVAIMYAGEIIEEASTEELYRNPLHPYTRLLLESIPVIGVDKELHGIEGSPPEPGSYPRGCRFHPRCPYRMGRCSQVEPPMYSNGDRIVKCWLYG